MNTAQLADVLSWLRTTDLVEVGYRRGREGFSLSTAEGSSIKDSLPPNRYQPVCSPAVGLFRWSAPGKPRKAEEGADVGAGETLGLVEGARGRSEAVKAPGAGRLARVLCEDGATVEFGQLLFLIEPR